MISLISILAVPFIMAPQPARPTAPSVDTDSSHMTLVVVQNDRNVPVTIYAQNSVVEQKIGVVDALSTATINIDDVMRWGADIQFFVQPAGGAELSSDYMELDRGEHLGLVVPPAK